MLDVKTLSPIPAQEDQGDEGELGVSNVPERDEVAQQVQMPDGEEHQQPSSAPSPKMQGASPGQEEERQRKRASIGLEELRGQPGQRVSQAFEKRAGIPGDRAQHRTFVIGGRAEERPDLRVAANEGGVRVPFPERDAVPLFEGLVCSGWDSRFPRASDHAVHGQICPHDRQRGKGCGSGRSPPSAPVIAPFGPDSKTQGKCHEGRKENQAIRACQGGQPDARRPIRETLERRFGSPPEPL